MTKEVVVLSGKGGTGKTTVLAALAQAAADSSRLVLADVDLDAANLGLLLAPRTLAEHDFVGGRLPVIAHERCIDCGSCLEACRFDALSKAEGTGRYVVDPVACEGCAACKHRCPAGAISMEEQVAGRWFLAETRFGPLVHAHLFAGQENSGKLVTTVKQQARELAQRDGHGLLLVDGPPGIGCPVIAACAGADLALLVAEPTVAGAHDLERVLATVRHFRVRPLVCINKYDVNPARSGEIERFCAQEGVAVVGRIPFDTAVTEAMVAGLTIGEWARQAPARGEAVAREMASIWSKTQAFLLD